MRRILIAMGALVFGAGGAQALELLQNGNLNDPGIHESDAIVAWTLDEFLTAANTPMENTATFASFADRTGGGTGLWLRPFESETEPGDAILAQIVPGTPGFHYSFSGWSKWEAFYSGGLPTTTGTFMEIRFLDAGDAGLAAVLLDLRGEQQNDSTWRQHVLAGVAPAGTVSVLVTAYALDMFRSDGNPQSAFFDDFSLECRECTVPEPAGLVAGGIGALALALRRRVAAQRSS